MFQELSRHARIVHVEGARPGQKDLDVRVHQIDGDLWLGRLSPDGDDARCVRYRELDARVLELLQGALVGADDFRLRPDQPAVEVPDQEGVVDVVRTVDEVLE